MGAYLTFDDYCESGWGAVALSEDPLSYRSFWAAVLQFAAADGGVAVHYDVNAGEDCLAVEVDGGKHAMEPPPAEIRRSLLVAVRRLSCDEGVGSFLRRLCASLPRRRYWGQILLYSPYGDIAWNVYGDRCSVSMYRDSVVA